MADDEYLWMANQRIGKLQPSTAIISANGGAQCSCALQAQLGNGYHCRVCRRGGGPIRVHHGLRDVFHAACGNAGVVAETEYPGLLPDGNERPADVLAMGLGDHGEDLVIDVCVYDPLAGLAALSLVQTIMRRTVVAHEASEAERMKRRKKPHGQPDGPTMEQRVSAIGKTFYPIGFETFGATTTQCTKLIKKLSEKAHERRGHDKATFRRYWTAEIAMCLAKRGAQVALSRAFALSAEREVGLQVAHHDHGPLGAPDAAPFDFGLPNQAGVDGDGMQI